MEYNLAMIIIGIHLATALVGAIGAIEYMNAPPSKPKRKSPRSAFAGLALLFLAISGAAMAQDVAKTDEKVAPKAEKALPATAKIAADKVRELSAASRDAENANLRASNLELQIEKAQRQLQDLRDAAKKASDAAQVKSRATFEAAGVPSDKLDQYDIKENPDGSLELTKKAPAKKE